MHDLLTIQASSPMEKAAQLVELEALKKQVAEKIASYKEDLLKVTQEQGVLTLKTEKYTISRAKRVTPRVVDFDALKASLDSAKIPYETQEVFADFMTPVFKQAIEEGRDLDGLEGQTTEYITIRVKEGEKHE